VDITADGNWGLDRLDVALVDQDLLGLLAQGLNAVLGERLAITECSNLLVQIADIREVDFGHFLILKINYTKGP
jgi:hypothetical protein